MRKIHDLTNKKDIIMKCKPYTLVQETHLMCSIDLVDDINNNNIEGDLIECGVWSGGCSMTIAMSQLKT